MPPSLENARTGLITQHVFLDTEVYRRYYHDLNNKVLQTLLQRTRDQISTLHITDITLAEIKRQLSDMATEVALRANKGNRRLRKWCSVHSKRSGDQPMQADVDAEALAEEAVRNFTSAMSFEWRPNWHSAVKISAEGIFKQYFRRDPPFDELDSKEFPDAFVVSVLDSWCQKTRQKMYVISKDKAMLRAVAQTATLVPLSTLEDYLALLVVDTTVIKKVESILKSSAWNTVELRVCQQVGELGVEYAGDLCEGAVIHLEVDDGPIELIEFDVIAVSEKQIEVVAKVQAPISFDVLYLDTSSAFWDQEEWKFIGGEHEAETFKSKVKLSILIVIDQQNNGIASVDILTRDVSVREPYENFK